MNRPPAYYEDLADVAEQECKWDVAARHWISAAGASIGHGRAQRYRDRAEYCRTLHAAPDLLDACKTAFAVFAIGLPIADADRAAVSKIMRDAINKATGDEFK